MALIPEPEHTTIRAVYAALESEQEREPRTYLGASVIGRPCARALWYDFRWCQRPTHSHDGRLLRLLRRGHDAEAEMIADLRAAGVEVHADDGSGTQFGFTDLGGHFAGHMDGAALGLVEAPKTWHVVECKTHNAKSFAALVKDGVQKSKPEHYAQMQIYMHWSGMKRAYYLAENKDTSELYAERVKYDAETAQKLVAKAESIIFGPEPPARISEKPEYYICKWCDYHGLCHGKRPEATPRPSCRTCCHSTPMRDGKARWLCERHQCDIPHEHAPAGCDDHVYMPALLPWAEVQDMNGERNCIEYARNGAAIRQGTKAPDVYSSAEVYRVTRGGSVDVLFDCAVKTVRQEFNGELVE